MALRMTAYCDESGTEGRDFLFAGYIAPASQWLPIEQAWNQALAGFGLREFHARDCQAGEGEFKDRDDRLEIQNKFYSIVDSAAVDGVAVRIDLTTFEKVRRKLAPQLQRDLNEVYFHAFTAQLRMLADFALNLSRDERIGFVFDEQDEFRGRALQMFEDMKTMPAVSFRHRLGGILFEDSKRMTLLQAADALAYRIHRDFANAEPVYISTTKQYRPRVHVVILGSAIGGEL